MRHIKSFNESVQEDDAMDGKHSYGYIFWEKIDLAKDIFSSWLDDLNCYIVPRDYNHKDILSYDFVIRKKDGMDMMYINILPVIDRSREHKDIINNMNNLISTLKSNFVDASFKQRPLNLVIYGFDRFNVRVSITIGESE